MRRKDSLQPVPVDIALAMASALVRKNRPVIGIGSPRASLEANYMLRMLVGPEYFYAGVHDEERRLTDKALQIMRQGPAGLPSLEEAARADAVFLLGENVCDTAPLLALRLRHLIHVHAARIARQSRIPAWSDAGIREVAQQEKETLFIATPYPTRLDDEAKLACRAHPDDLARLGFCVAALLDPAAPQVADLPDRLRAAAGEIAAALKTAERPLVVAGIGCRHRGMIDAAANITRALAAKGAQGGALYTFPECNSAGVGLLGSRGGVDSALEVIQNGAADTVIILENDLFRRMDVDRAEAFFNCARHVICLDHLQHATTEHCDLLLPAATFAETSGTLVNNSGRAQRFFQVFAPGDAVRASWRWLRDMMAAAGRPEAQRLNDLDDVLAAMAADMPIWAGLREAAPDGGFRLVGRKVPRQSHRASGRTAWRAQVNVHEFPPPQDADAPLAFSMEGNEEPLPPAGLIPRFWRPRWNSVQSLNKFQQEIGGILRGGNAGRRLIEPPPDRTPQPYFQVPPHSVPPPGAWSPTPISHVFGSEELSIHSPGIAARTPAPYVGLSPAEAAAMGCEEGARLKVTLSDKVYYLPLRLVAGLAPRTVALPVGLPDLPAIPEALSVKIEKSEE
jgi:NADH-quinone oxidoreductase subunit G